MSKTVSKSQTYLFNAILFWVITTSLFTWLSLVRIIGRPNEYYWGILGRSGEGMDGPYWIFIVGLVYVLLLFYSVFRIKTRAYSYALILLWSFFVIYVIVKTILASGDSTIQGQGLHWEFRIWFLIIPALLFTLCTSVWIAKELKNGVHFTITPWQKGNTKKLLLSLVLLIAAIVLFSLGNNYNWITSLAIITTIFQWIVLVESLKPLKDV